MSRQIALKILVLGDGGVGKTTLTHRYVKGQFIDTTTMTIGVEFLTKLIEVDPLKAQLALWDISGQERFFFMIEKYLRGASGALLLYDITNMKSFVNLGKWVQVVKDKNPDHADIPIILIAAKCDLEEFSLVGDMYSKNAMKKFGFIDFVKTSSKTGLNVDQAFKKLVKYIIETRGF